VTVDPTLKFRIVVGVVAGQRDALRERAPLPCERGLQVGAGGGEIAPGCVSVLRRYVFSRHATLRRIEVAKVIGGDRTAQVGRPWNADGPPKRAAGG
jgi:hypothetical protein